MINYCLKLFSYNELFNHFVNLEIKNNLPSRILLTGQEGIGKTTFAYHLINYLLSKNEIKKYNKDLNIVNNESNSFTLINNLSHPNLFLVAKDDTKKNIDIDQIRRMINFLNKSSFDNQKKIILIDGAENLNINSSNALLKSLEESSNQNLFILTQNINKNLLDTIKSRCITFKLNFNYSEIKNVVNENLGTEVFDDLHDDFKSLIISPSFLINHINFAKNSSLNINSLNIEEVIKFVIKNKSYKKDNFISNNFQLYIEIYFSKKYSKTKDYKYYDNFLETVTENNQIDKFNLDLDSFFIKFENKYLNI